MSSPIAQRLTDLRAQMTQHDLDGWCVPICDEHMSEYVGDYAQRLAWLTGFTGSAGSAVVLKDKAALFVDGRYTTQAREQITTDALEQLPMPEHSIISYIAEHAQEGTRIGYDPWLHTHTWAKAAQKALLAKGAALVPHEGNLIDTIWDDQPKRPALPIANQPKTYTGQSREDKLSMCAEAITKAGADMGVIASLDGIAWTLNLRGRDIAHSPVAFGFLIIHSDGKAVLCMNTEQMEPALKEGLNDVAQLAVYEDFSDIFASVLSDDKTVMLDPQTAVSALFKIVEAAGAAVVLSREPSTLAKACKTHAEQEGTRAAHVRDGVALSQFLTWFDAQAPGGGLTELMAADRLATERARQEHFQDLSFRTISAAAHHAALPHYSVTPQSNIAIPADGLYLVDSGGQYLDGTTDVTRTIQVGEISSDAKKRYTQVLKGHIAVATVRFPKGTPGRAIDTLARMALWADGADYDHGTGHGVGSYLNVHEGPQRIAKAGADEPLQPGMILSNEPGYYKDGAFGIRIENLVIVQSAHQAGDEREMYGFETITLAPIDRRPIVKDLLTQSEIRWLDDYHARVWDALSPRVHDAAKPWLRDRTRAL